MNQDFDSPTRRAGAAAAYSLIDALWGLRIGGRERIPAQGPLIVAANHSNFWDPPVLAAAVAPVRRPRFLAKREIFSWPVLGRFSRAVGSIPLDRGGADISALRTALETLEAGGSIAIFPEGTRLRSGQPRPPRLGVSFLAERARAAVLPVRLLGMERFPWAFPLEARIGIPLPPPPADGGRESAAEFARAVMSAVYAL